MNTKAGQDARTWPIVEPDPASATFFDAARTGNLLMKGCRQSGTVLGNEVKTCPECGSIELVDVIVSGRATLVSWAVVHQAPVPVLDSAVPYVTAIVELQEGPWVFVRLVGINGYELRIGTSLEARFVRPESPEGEASGGTLPVFAPADSG